jgi:hypothetical protein
VELWLPESTQALRVLYGDAASDDRIVPIGAEIAITID